MSHNSNVTVNYDNIGTDIPPPDDEVASSMLAEVLADVLAANNSGNNNVNNNSNSSSNISTSFDMDITEHGRVSHRHGDESSGIDMLSPTTDTTKFSTADTLKTDKESSKITSDKQKIQTKTKIETKPNCLPTQNCTPNEETNTKFDQQHMAELREQDRWLPINNVARLMKNTLPTTAKVSKDAKKCMQECVSEFISFVTSEAGDRCAADKRKTINGEDILISLHVLGFENYAEVLKIYLAKYRYQQALRNQQMLEKEGGTANCEEGDSGSGNSNSNGSGSSSSRTTPGGSTGNEKSSTTATTTTTNTTSESRKTAPPTPHTQTV